MKNRENTLPATSPVSEELERRRGRARWILLRGRVLLWILRLGLRGGARVGVAERAAGPFPERYANDMQINACEPASAV